MPLLINDANIFIDLDTADLTRHIFDLPYLFATPDVLFYEELRTQHGELPGLGLQLLELAGDRMQRVSELRERYSANSFNDCMALALAEQESCPLLTGDRNLRKAAQTEGVEVRGTLWLIEEMVIHSILHLSQAYTAYEAMEKAERRLPFLLARRRLQERFEQ